MSSSRDTLRVLLAWFASTVLGLPDIAWLLRFVKIEWIFSTIWAYGQITLNTPVLVRSPKLGSVELDEYLDGWPLGNIRYLFSIV